MPQNSQPDVISSPTGLSIYYKGPGLTYKHLPALFYFALSGEESLYCDPYNQPVMHLSNEPIHLFSFTVPAHGPGYDHTHAMRNWAHAIEQGDNVIAEFVERSIKNIDYLISQGYIDAHHIAVAGLSRGGFIATHIAAADARIRTVLGYAPLTRLDYLEEFQKIQQSPIVQALSLSHLADKLVKKHVRFYIGNRDVRVGTDECYQCIRHIVEVAHSKGVRSPSIELMISPSIGHKGHGTPPQIFQDGVKWVKERFKDKS